MQYVILSLGQLVEPKMNLSLNAFAQILKEQGRWFAYTRTCLAYFLDLKYYHTLERFNKGLLDKHQFYEKICRQLNIRNLEEESVQECFWNSWKKMCELDEGGLDLLRNLNSLLVSIQNIDRELPIFIFVSNTNLVHHDHIIDDFFKKDDRQKLIDNSIWCLSYEVGTISHKELAQKAIANLEFRDGDVLISCHRRVDSSVVPEGSSVKFIQSGFTVNELNKALSDSYVSLKR
jgi:hypothetical protein